MKKDCIAIQGAPCVSCPYRRDVPSGVWAPEEYEKLYDYDGETFGQPMAMFMCHGQNGSLCRGWLDCHGDQLLAVRIGLSTGDLDPVAVNAALDAGPAVPVFGSGEEAALHGMAAVSRPGGRARRLIRYLRKKADLRSEKQNGKHKN